MLEELVALEVLVEQPDIATSKTSPCRTAEMFVRKSITESTTLDIACHSNGLMSKMMKKNRELYMKSIDIYKYIWKINKVSDIGICSKLL